MSAQAQPAKVTPFAGGNEANVRQNRRRRFWPNRRGCLAQLVERRPYKANVGGSIPSAPTIFSSNYGRFLAAPPAFIRKSAVRLPAPGVTLSFGNHDPTNGVSTRSLLMSYHCSCSSSTPAPWEVWEGWFHIPRHRHAQAYGALIVAGGYEESGSFGRFRVRPGDVLLHRAFDSHLDHFGPRGARILSLPLQAAALSQGFGRIGDPDEVVRLSEGDLLAAAASLAQQLTPCEVPAADWPDMLAADLIRDPTLQLREWAQRHGLAQETLARGFRRVFGMTPAAFRAEARAQVAWRGIARTDLPMVQIAAEAGFADQSHMTRAIVELTGSSPGRWRASNCFKTCPEERL